MAGGAVLADPLSGITFVIVVVAAEAAWEWIVAKIVGIGSP